MVSEVYVSRLPYWNDLEKDEKEAVACGAVIREYKKGAYIYGMQDACLGMVYVQKGSIRVFLTSEAGREVTLFHIGEGDSCLTFLEKMGGALWEDRLPNGWLPKGFGMDFWPSF